MTIKAALLDENGVYLKIAEVADASQLGERHLPGITACDLPPGQYRWVPDPRNPMGGSFWALKTLARMSESLKILAS